MKREEAVFGGGCFWCVEHIFNLLKGVDVAISGYAGGLNENPTYEEVCTGQTMHAEVVKVIFDPSIISYATLLEVFWHVHDPTQLNKQGNDVGTQYRSVIYYLNDEQKQQAEESKKFYEQEGKVNFVTEIEPLETFYSAEEYHQRYFENNPTQPYCMAVVSPKVQKFLKNYQYLLK